MSTTTATMTDLFGGVISTYTRAQALEDGQLVDVTDIAREAGIQFPLAVTQALWADIKSIPPRFQGWQSVQGRLWDVIWMSRGMLKLFDHRRGLGGKVPMSGQYDMTMHVGRKTYYRVKVVLSLGDQGEPVLTLMRPDED